MSRDRLIEDMIKAFDDYCNNEVPDEECVKYRCIDCHAKSLIKAGYRKSSEVAREIFEEIKASSSSCVAECNGREIYGTKTYTIKATKLDEILKKYESEDTE